MRSFRTKVKKWPCKYINIGKSILKGMAIIKTPFQLVAEHYFIDIVPRIGRHTPEEKENTGIDGFILVTDGSKLLEKAKRGMVCRPRDGFRRTEYISDDRDFLEHLLASYSSGDLSSSDVRVLFFNSPNSSMTEYIGELTNNYKGVEHIDELIKKNLPSNYSSLGARTGAFVLTPRAFEGVKTVVLKESGNGSVAHADYNGLIEQITVAPRTIGSDNPVFIYRRYRDENGKPIVDKDGRIALLPENEHMVDRNFKDIMTGQYVGPYRGPLASEPLVERIISYAKRALNNHQARNSAGDFNTLRA